MPKGLGASRWATAPDTIDTYRVSKPRHRRRSYPTLPISSPPTPTPLEEPIPLRKRSRRRRRRAASREAEAVQSASLPSQHSSESTPIQTLKRTPNHRASPQTELSRFLKIVTRLNWKLPFLKQGYSLAKDTNGKTQQQKEACEIQFKLDFHEFYMLLERAIVHLMGVYGIAVDGQQRMDGRHRYHANVLATLEDANNPLSGVFGTPEVSGQLATAKELRNRWKDADEYDGKIRPVPLSSYNLETIVQTILGAIDQAHGLASEYVSKGGEEMQDAEGEGDASGREDWDFMVDAMDWEAV
ncbi:uncharacterized protein GGS25DRAFT_492923 [Hypoxylon fragiforme]|uniref:uncharacterized protein n=1 Tax=Hypoxylon fragiforme TaxID=63214 RepID=UPI0020C67F30|nr:uncharacterized protein GGS25DRAFT_492923 [Hypoxylon fragiforme]KAI2609080.1 hypothetical protein GGS25DRAFT_492923 [Hypoxylon fragiforme]